MSEENLYYIAPSDEAFNNLKEKAIEIWGRYPHPSKKVDNVKRIENIRDNFMYLVAMFDIHNQKELSALLDKNTRRQVRKRLEAGGAPDEINYFKN